MSDIPYNKKFGSAAGRDESLAEYIDEMETRSLGAHPWYVFKGHPVPQESDEWTSLVNLATIKTPW